MNDTTISLGWGSNAHPPTATAAWGARLIVTQDGYVDLVPDRQDAQGPDVDTLIGMLNNGIIRQIKETVGDLLRSYDMDTRQHEDFIVYMQDGVIAHANTNASAGYCYVSAWLDEEGS